MTDRSATLTAMPTKALTSAPHSTREALLDAGTTVLEQRGLAGLSVNQVVASAGVAKGTFYVHFQDRASFVDALHERFHARVQEAVASAAEGMQPGPDRIVRGSEAYLDVCLANRGVKALAFEARSDPALMSSMAARHGRFASAAIPDLKAMGWPDATAASHLLAAMTQEISIREFDAHRRLPSARRALRRFLGL
jgi:TetR/AcrR family transcriptional regulator, transcriptional repressor for nem operon